MSSPADRVISRSAGLRIRERSFFVWLQFLLDVMIVLGVLAGAVALKSEAVAEHYQSLAVLIVLVMWMVYRGHGVYRRPGSFVTVLPELTRVWVTSVMVVLVIAFLSKTSAIFSREVMIEWAVFGWIGQVTAHYAVHVAAHRRAHHAWGVKPVLMVGSGWLARHLANRVNNSPWLAEEVVGIVDDDAGEENNRVERDMDGIPWMGRIDQLHDLIEKHDVRRVYLALPMRHAGMVQDLYLDLLERHVDVTWAPDIFGMNLLNHSITELDGVPLLSLAETPMSEVNAVIKASMDKVLALLALILLSPVMVSAALAVKLTSPGPVLFKQKRHGTRGEEILVWKFRSMRVDTKPGEFDDYMTGQDDPRVTPVGRFIRRTSIDELPQLFNVLGGSMSMVGPRPQPVEVNQYYQERMFPYMVRHRIKPGITGLAQISGYRGETDTIDKMERRLAYDLEYINNWSVERDLYILLKTAMVLFSKNAY